MEKLIKISDHYVIIDDSEIKEGDHCLMFDDFGNIFLGNEPKQYLGESNGHFLNKGLRKVTHSTNQLEGVKVISLPEVEELVNDYSVEKMANDQWGNTHRTGVLGYIDGFKAHQELTKDKLFTIEDIDMAYIQGKNDESISGNKKKMREDYLKSLLPKSEWLVEFKDGKLKLI